VKQRHNSLLVLVSLAWVAIIVSLYFVSHKPFTLELALSLVRAGGQLLVAVGLVSLAGGFGTCIISAKDSHPLERLVLQAALGLGLMSVFVLLLGWILGLNPMVMWLLYIGAGALLWRPMLKWWRNWRTFTSIWKDAGSLEMIFAIVVGFTLLTTLITALAPPLKFDALVYHLTIPSAYLDAGRISYLPWTMFWGMPQTAEMLFMWVMALAGAEAAAVLGWLIGVLALVGIFGFVSHRLNAFSAWVAVATLMAGYTSASSLAWGYVDWMTALFGCAFLISLENWCTHQKRSVLIYSGVFAGLALGTKYTAGVLLFCGLVVIAWHGRKEALSRQFHNVIQFAVAALSLSSPWWVKNLLATGNPFYPLLYPAGAMDPFRLDFYQDQPLYGGLLDMILLPFKATIDGIEGAMGFNASIGPLLLALGGLSWIGWKQRPDDQRSSVVVAGIVSGVGLVTWAAASRFSGLLIQTRLYFSLFPAFTFLAGAGYQGLWQIKIPNLRLGRVVGLLVLLVLGLNILKIGDAVLRQNAPQFIFSITSKEDYLLNNLGWFAWVMESIDELPEESRVLMLWEPRSFYCTPICIPDEVLDRWIREARSGKDVDGIVTGWGAQGVTHLLYYQEGADFIRREDDRYKDDDWQLLDQLLDALPAPLDFGDVYALYPLTPP